MQDARRFVRHRNEIAIRLATHRWLRASSAILSLKNEQIKNLIAPGGETLRVPMVVWAGR
jgi:hypothetical protein